MPCRVQGFRFACACLSVRPRICRAGGRETACRVQGKQRKGFWVCLCLPIVQVQDLVSRKETNLCRYQGLWRKGHEVVGLGLRVCLCLPAVQIKDLVSRARAGKLAPHEFQGGSFR